MPDTTHGGKTAARLFRVFRGPIILENLLQLVLRIFRIIDDHLVAAVVSPIAAIAVTAVTIAAVAVAAVAVAAVTVAAIAVSAVAVAAIAVAAIAAAAIAVTAIAVAAKALLVRWGGYRIELTPGAKNDFAWT